MVDPVGLGTLGVGIVTLVVAALAFRSARRAARLTEERIEELREEQERLAYIREEQEARDEELKLVRLERAALQEELKSERQERLAAQKRAEQAEQEALKEATKRLWERMGLYLKELEGDESPELHRVK